MIARFTIPALLAAMAWGAAPAAAQSTPDERILLDTHNAERAEFGVPPLAWSDNLAREALAWARHLARENRLEHSQRAQRDRQGENLWMGTTGAYTADQMIAHFASEKRDFAPGRFPQVSRTGRWWDVGHYTQMVWGETREVGCALARNQRFDVLVCRYWPGGNVIGQMIAPQRSIARR